MNSKSAVLTLLLVASCRAAPSNTAGEDAQVSPGERAYSRAAVQHEWLATRDPILGYVPARRLQSARRVMGRRLALGPAAVGQGVDLAAPPPWECRGPDHVAGRVRALAIDPGTSTGRRVFLGGVNGGVWVLPDLSDPASRWRPVSEEMGAQPVTALAFDPADARVLYAGTGEGWIPGIGLGLIGTGLWVSNDGGQNWRPLPATRDFAYVNDLVVRLETGGSVLYVAVDASDYNGAGAGANHGLYRSTDGGASFTQVLPLVGGSPYAPADLHIGPGGRLHVGTLANPDGLGGGATLFSDDGLQWNVAPIPTAVDRVKIAASPDDPARVYALVEGGVFETRLQRSLDGGLTWAAAPSAPFMPGFIGYRPAYNLALAVAPGDPNQVWAGAVGLGRSLDGGASIDGVPLRVHADIHALRYRRAAPSEVLVASDGGLSWVRGAGAGTPTFVNRNGGLTITQLYTVALDPRPGATRFLAGTQDNDAMLLSGPELTSGAIAVDGDGGFGFFDVHDPQFALATRQGNVWHRTLDGGATWSFIPGQSGGTFVNPADYDERRNILYSGATNAGLQRIRDLDSAPTVDTVPVAFGPTTTGATSLTALRLFPHGADVLFAGTAEGRLFRIDGASSQAPAQTEIGSPAFPSGSISCIECGRSTDELRVVFSNYGVSSVWETVDGGLTWRSAEGDLPDMPVRWLLSNPDRPEHVLLATELGIWETRSFDALSPRWMPLLGGPPRARTNMLRYRSAGWRRRRSDVRKGPLHGASLRTAVGASN